MSKESQGCKEKLDSMAEFLKSVARSPHSAVFKIVCFQAAPLLNSVQS